LGPVLTENDGSRLEVSALVSRWRDIRDAAGIEDFKWHDLRHTTASLLAQNGASLPEIAHQLGHKSTVVTTRYTHLLKGRAVTGHAELDEKMRTALDAATKKPAQVQDLKP
jgi:integrase